MGECLKGVIKMVWKHTEDQELPKPKRKTNRDALQGMDLYDMLWKMQERLHECSEFTACIMDALGAKYVAERCVSYDGRCKKCIAAWLNEESDTV